MARPFDRFRLGFSITKALLGWDTADTLYFDSADETGSALAHYIRSSSASFET